MNLETALLIKEYRKFYGLDTNREAVKWIKRTLKAFILSDESTYLPSLFLDPDENTDTISGLLIDRIG